MVRYQKYITNLIENFDEVHFIHLPQEENQMTDALATLATMFQVGVDVKIQPIIVATTSPQSLPASKTSGKDPPSLEQAYLEFAR